MMKRVLASVFILFGLIHYLVGQERKVLLADSILNARGEIFFSFSSAYFNWELGKILSIKSVGKNVLAYANKSSFEKFRELNIDFELQPENFTATRFKSASLADPDVVYPSYFSYLQLLQEFQQKYNSLCELHEIGLSVQGRKIMAVKISAGNTTRAKPAVMLTSSIHGNELVGFKLSLWLIDFLLKNYNSDPQVTNLINGTEIWIIPLTNPDGTYFGGNNTVTAATRFNSNNLDLNRNFPDPEDGTNPDNAARQPETRTIMEFYKSKGIVLSAALHTGDELVNYPWDTWPKLHPDNNWYRTISRGYVDHVHAKNRLYMTDFENGIVNGFTWYRITGGLQDYVNYFLNSREITLELSKTDMPDSVALLKLWDLNREALLYFLEQSQYGLTGKITSKETGNPIKAKVELVNHDKDNSWVYSDGEYGIFYRFVATGNYSIKITAPGFLPFVEEVSLGAGERQTFDVQLKPDQKFVTVYPNPFSRSINLQFKRELKPEDEIRLSLTDISGRIVFARVVNNTGSPVELLIPSIPDGLYILRIQSKNFSEKFQILKIE